MMRRLQQLSQLTSAQRRALAHACVLIPWTLLRLHTRGYDRFRRSVDALPVHTSTSPEALRPIGEAVNIAARHGPWACTCLPRSMVLHELLRRRGLGTQLRIGVRRDAGGIEAHAWVEYDGQPINDRPDVANDYLPFDGDTAAAHFGAS